MSRSFKITEGAPLPDVSVVIPARNAVHVIGAQLESMRRQDFGGNWEVIVADNGSTDETRQLITSIERVEPRIRAIDASRVPGAAAARNAGARAARAKKLLFADADDVVASDWVRLLSNALDTHDVVGGWLRMFLQRPGDLAGPGRSAVAPFGSARFVITACMGIRRTVLEEADGFDESWGPGEDIELSLRLIQAGYELTTVDDALVHKRVADLPREVWIQHYRYGVQRARAAALFPEFADRQRFMRVVRKWLWIMTRLPTGWRDRNVLGPAAMACGRIVGSIRYRTVYF